MGALTLRDLDVSVAEPRLHDLKLATALGFRRPRAIRQVIERNLPEIETHGALAARATTVEVGKGARRAVTEYWLSEPQALLVCMFARTPTAAEVRRQVIAVFMAWRHGQTPPARSATAAFAERSWERMSSSLNHARTALDFDDQATPAALAMSAARLPIWSASRKAHPTWWADVEVRISVIAAHRQMTLDAAIAALTERFGPDRCPSRSSLGRFWRRWDNLNGQGVH